MIGSTLNFNSGSAGFAATISTNQQELNLSTWATGQGWDGTMAATITVGSGVYIWSDDTATPALTTGSFPGGLTLIVEGFIMGKGGDGGGNTPDVGSPTILASAGGPAISLGCDATILGGAAAYIGGGGGGGGNLGDVYTGGGGAGGGWGGNGGPSGEYYGGAGGAIGTSGGMGTTSSGTQYLPGSGGGSGGGGSGFIA